MAERFPERKEKTILRFRELFHGRFQREEAAKLLDLKEWNIHEAVTFVFSSNSRDLRDIIGRAETTESVRRDHVLRDLALRDDVAPTVRQFGCGPCHHMWWKKVPGRKQVSKCNRCGIQYDPIPKEVEYGPGIFECKCGYHFIGRAQMGVKSTCYTCGRQLSPIRIDPSLRKRRRKTNKKHSCEGCSDKMDESADSPTGESGRGGGGRDGESGSDRGGRDGGSGRGAERGRDRGGRDGGSGRGAERGRGGGGRGGESGRGGGGRVGESGRGGGGRVGERGRDGERGKGQNKPRDARPKKCPYATNFFVASERHVSTGSTVSTFLTQDTQSTTFTFDSNLSSVEEDEVN